MMRKAVLHVRRAVAWSAAAAALGGAPACARPSRSTGAASGALAVRPAGSLRYDIEGSGPAIVLVHGGLVDRRSWDGQVAELARDHRVIRYDIRGFGASTPAVPGFSFIDDLHAVVTALGVERATLVGLSLGGMIATEYALEHPEHVAGLVLVGAPLRGIATPDPMGMDIAAVARADTARAVRLLLDSVGMGSAIPAARERLRTLFAANLRGWAFVDPRIVRWPSGVPARRLGELRVPTLVLVGTRDAAPLHVSADSLAARIPGAERDSIVGAQHHPNVEQPAAFNAVLRRFLVRHRL